LLQESADTDYGYTVACSFLYHDHSGLCDGSILSRTGPEAIYGTMKERREMLVNHQEKIKRQIQELTEHLEIIQEKVALYADLNLEG
jgi:hypothetical protein